MVEVEGCPLASRFEEVAARHLETPLCIYTCVEVHTRGGRGREGERGGGRGGEGERARERGGGRGRDRKSVV